MLTGGGDWHYPSFSSPGSEHHAIDPQAKEDLVNNADLGGNWHYPSFSSLGSGDHAIDSQTKEDLGNKAVNSSKDGTVKYLPTLQSKDQDNT